LADACATAHRPGSDQWNRTPNHRTSFISFATSSIPASPILLDEAKTQLVDATQASFKFRGFTIQMSRRASTGKPYPNVRPADKSLKKTKA
jgi:hypothetical protein